MSSIGFSSSCRESFVWTGLKIVKSGFRANLKEHLYLFFSFFLSPSPLSPSLSHTLFPSRSLPLSLSLSLSFSLLSLSISLSFSLSLSLCLSLSLSLSLPPSLPLSQELFLQLVPYHCLGSLWSQRDKKGHEGQCWSVRETVRQFNRLANAVSASCLWRTDLRSQQRARLLEKWISVAEVSSCLRRLRVRELWSFHPLLFLVIWSSRKDCLSNITLLAVHSMMGFLVNNSCILIMISFLFHFVFANNIYFLIV